MSYIPPANVNPPLPVPVNLPVAVPANTQQPPVPGAVNPAPLKVSNLTAPPYYRVPQQLPMTPDPYPTRFPPAGAPLVPQPLKRFQRVGLRSVAIVPPSTPIPPFLPPA